MRASAWKSGLFATKSVSQFTSTITPSFAPARCGRVSQSDARHPAGCSRVSQSDSARWAIRREKRTCVDVRLDDALAGRPARLLVDRRQALGAQSLHGNFSVALRLHQRLLAVHHASARLIAQGLDRLRVDLDCCAGQGSTRVKRQRVLVQAGCVPHPPSSTERCAAPSQPSASTPLAS